MFVKGRVCQEGGIFPWVVILGMEHNLSTQGGAHDLQQIHWVHKCLGYMNLCPRKLMGTKGDDHKRKAQRNNHKWKRHPMKVKHPALTQKQIQGLHQYQLFCDKLGHMVKDCLWKR
jgi:hypothetical protein